MSILMKELLSKIKTDAFYVIVESIFVVPIDPRS